MSSAGPRAYRYSISRPAWVAIACVAGLGLYDRIRQPPEANTIEFLFQDQPVLVRLTDRTVAFPLLGAVVKLHGDWVYLSTTNPALSEHPTFVNAAAQAVVTLVPGWAADASIAGGSSSSPSGPQSPIDWLPMVSIEHELALQFNGVAMPIQWTSRSPQRIGRLRRDSLDLILIVSATSADANEAIDRFLEAIQPENAFSPVQSPSRSTESSAKPQISHFLQPPWALAMYQT